MSDYPQGIDRLMAFVFDNMPREAEPMNDTQLMNEILKELEKSRRAVEGQRDLMGGLSERLRWVEICTRQVAHKLKIGAIKEEGDLGHSKGD